MDAEDEPRFRCIHKESSSAWLKEGEAFTAVGAGPAYVALGTSKSSVIVATMEGEFICRCVRAAGCAA
jgi:shikimate kinase